MAPARVITLATDFGAGDSEAGVLKGVIWKIAPGTHIADLSHEIGPQDVLEGALLLERCTPYFPAGSIHVGVVDPGVGTRRRAIAAQLGDQGFVGPDNGLFTLMLARAEALGGPIQIVKLDQPQYWLPTVTDVFHGRDVFSPAAAHWANGVPLEALGTPMADPVRLEVPEPQRIPGGWRAQIIHVDHFGNLSTRLRREHLGDTRSLRVHILGRQIDGLVKTFGERPSGALVALFNSSGTLDISVVNGSAADALGAQAGDPLEVRFPDEDEHG